MERLQRFLFRIELSSILLLFCSSIFGQSPGTPGTPGLDANPNPKGGGAIANYAELIGLIEATINPDGWEAAGGNASMMEFRQGVRINPEGLIERFEQVKKPTNAVKKPTSESKSPLVSLNSLGEWAQPSSLRWISLNELDRQLSNRTSRATPTMELLGGLYRIDYVAFDPETKGWFLGGPSGGLSMGPGGDILNTETKLPPVLLEDLLTVAPHILHGKGEFGCTIDPDPKRLVESGRLVSTAASMKALARNPDRWLEGWRKTLGHQHAKVIGLTQDSPTGYALLIADAQMKRLAFDLDFRPASLKSYWQEVEFFGDQRQEMGLVRWWFSLTDHKIPVDPDRKIYQFVSSNVQVESEAQILNEAGKQVRANKQDLAADAYAKSFTRNFDQLQREHPSFGRLRHIFDLSVAFEIIRLEMENGNGEPFSFISELSVQPRMATAPVAIDTIASTHKMPNGSIAAIISGGVTINLNHSKARFKAEKDRVKEVSVERSFGELEAERASSVLGAEVPFWR